MPEHYSLAELHDRVKVVGPPDCDSHTFLEQLKAELDAIRADLKENTCD